VSDSCSLVALHMFCHIGGQKIFPKLAPPRNPGVVVSVKKNYNVGGIKEACNGALAEYTVEMPVLNLPHVLYCFEFSDAEKNVIFRRGISCRDLKETMLGSGFQFGDHFAKFTYEFQFTGLHQMTFWKNPISASDMSCDYIPTSVGHGCDCVARDLRLVVLGVTDSTSVVVFNGLMHDHIEEKTVIVNLMSYRKVKCRFYHCPTSSCKKNKNYL